MNRFNIILFLSLLLVGSALAQSSHSDGDELHWFTDIMEAHELSDSTKKPIFAFFTGSDWCGWCHRLEKDVFQKTEFIEWAKSNVILVELDYPRRKKLPEDLARQNGELQQAFRVSSFPTIWMFYLSKDAEAKKVTINALGSLGYPSGVLAEDAADRFISNANMIMAKKGK
jgi:protein disulfide-isomerase